MTTSVHFRVGDGQPFHEVVWEWPAGNPTPEVADEVRVNDTVYVVRGRTWAGPGRLVLTVRPTAAAAARPALLHRRQAVGLLAQALPHLETTYAFWRGEVDSHPDDQALAEKRDQILDLLMQIRAILPDDLPDDEEAAR